MYCKIGRRSFISTCVVLSWLFMHPATAATDYYFDDTGGNDSWSGNATTFTPPLDGPWKTLNKLRSYSNSNGFLPGDRILFKRGGTFTTNFSVSINSSGDSVTEQYVELADYGTGVKPILQIPGQALVDIPSSSLAWVHQTGDIWFYNYAGTIVNGIWRDGSYLRHDITPALPDGDFFWDEGVGIYYRSTTGNPNNENLFRGGTGYGFSIIGLSYVRFKNLHFAGGPTAIGGGSATAEPIHHITIEDCEFDDFITAIFIAATNGQNNHDLTIENNVFNRNGRSIFITSNNTTAKNINHIIRGNEIIDTDTNGNIDWFRASRGLSIDIEAASVQNPNANIITDNLIYNGAKGGALIFWSNGASTANNNEVARNTIHDVTGAAMSMFGSNIVDTHVGNSVHHNLIYNCSVAGGIRLSANDSQGSNAIYNNTMVNCGNSFYLNGQSSGFTITNNVSVNPTSRHIQHNGGFLQSDMSNNIYYPDAVDAFIINAADRTLSQWQTYTGQDLNSSTSDPLFEDIANADFHLTVSSPAIDAGVSVSQTNDIDNNPVLGLPDIGAYEFGNTDSDNDGLIDYDELCFDGNCQDYNAYDPVMNPTGTDTDINNEDTDGDGYRDGTEVTLGSNPRSDSSIPIIIADGDINLDGQLNAADILLAQRLLFNLTTLTAEQIAHGDFRPTPSGDGQLTLPDYVIIIQEVLSLP